MDEAKEVDRKESAGELVHLQRTRGKRPIEPAEDVPQERESKSGDEIGSPRRDWKSLQPVLNAVKPTGRVRCGIGCLSKELRVGIKWPAATWSHMCTQ
jgi:hypothetical protein